MRKHYLDNIRTVTILLLFPYHTFMIWNNFGPKFYIWGGNNIVLSSVIVSLSPWLMPVLFVIAGMSAKYSLDKRDTKEFIKERTKRLLLPLISALIILVPFQTLYARKFFFQYDKGIIDNFKYFFTHFSDLNGYDGMFTFGHLWFLLYLFIITLITLPLVKKIPHGKIKDKVNRINIFLIIFLFIPVFFVLPYRKFRRSEHRQILTSVFDGILPFHRRKHRKNNKNEISHFAIVSDISGDTCISLRQIRLL